MAQVRCERALLAAGSRRRLPNTPPSPATRFRPYPAGACDGIVLAPAAGPLSNAVSVFAAPGRLWAGVVPCGH